VCQNSRFYLCAEGLEWARRQLKVTDGTLEVHRPRLGKKMFINQPSSTVRTYHEVNTWAELSLCTKRRSIVAVGNGRMSF
jgi:hypothetical protein